MLTSDTFTQEAKDRMQEKPSALPCLLLCAGDLEDAGVDVLGF